VLAASVIKAMRMKDAGSISETSVNFCRTRSRNNPQDRHLHLSYSVFDKWTYLWNGNRLRCLCYVNGSRFQSDGNTLLSARFKLVCLSTEEDRFAGSKRECGAVAC
jgi:hypothetical protein